LAGTLWDRVSVDIQGFAGVTPQDGWTIRGIVHRNRPTIAFQQNPSNKVMVVRAVNSNGTAWFPAIQVGSGGFVSGAPFGIALSETGDSTLVVAAHANGNALCGSLDCILMTTQSYNFTGELTTVTSSFLATGAIDGSLLITNSSIVNSSSPALVSGAILIEDGAVLVISANQTGSYSVFTSGFLAGRFAVIAPTCPLVVQDTDYSSSTLTVTLAVGAAICSPDSQPPSTAATGGLSPGEIVGICVGVAAGAVVLAIGIVLLTRAVIARRTSTMRTNLKKQDMQNLKAAQTK
jgi:hypothetical protein